MQHVPAASQGHDAVAPDEAREPLVLRVHRDGRVPHDRFWPCGGDGEVAPSICKRVPEKVQAACLACVLHLHGGVVEDPA